jgi:intracellular septation protein A
MTWVNAQTFGSQHIRFVMRLATGDFITSHRNSKAAHRQTLNDLIGKTFP